MAFNFLEKELDNIVLLCEAHGVSRLDAFGSVLRNNFGPDSDVDLLVTFRRGDGINAFEQYFDFKEALEALLQRNVDLVCANAIRNTHFKAEVEASSRMLYAA